MPESRRIRWILAGAAAVATAAAAVVTLIPPPGGMPVHRAKPDRGRELSARYCSTCHLEPDPGILPKRSWEAALGYMGYWLGMENLDYLSAHPRIAMENVRTRREVMMRDGLLPGAPALTLDEWDMLRDHYVRNAPATPLPQSGKPVLRRELPRFRIAPCEYRMRPAVTTLVRIRPERREIYVGDALAQRLTVLDGEGRVRTTVEGADPGLSPVDIEFIDGAAYVGSIGDLVARQPSNSKPARITAFPLRNESPDGTGARTVIDHLYRMADMEPADLNGDGRLDFIVCGFGVLAGGVSWFESRPDGGYVEHSLIPQPGAVRAQAHDFNGDGRPDIAVLLAHAREGFHILVNRGGGEFEDHVIFQTHPAYGHTWFELQDFDGDGRQDLLVVNGDAVDSDPYNTRKNYHGLRIYLNRGGLRFEEAYFYPMYGAFIAKARDFDRDGDLDIAAISFYPDFSSDRPESFVYLQNRGGLKFDAFTLEDAAKGRWMTLDAGDIDGDGDIDVVLGGSYIPLGMFAHLDLFRRLAETGPSLLILKNTLH